MSLPLSPEVFRILAALIEERTGIHYDPSDRDILADKLTARAVERELPSLLDYYYFLRYDAAAARELDALVETLVVQETYLFREVDQLRALVDRLVPSFVAARSGKPVRIWCAACATGEEPVTLGVFLRQAGRLSQVEILASDISARALAKAEAGVFRGRSLRVLDAHAGRDAFQRASDGSVRVDPEVSARIRWLRLNLCDATAIAALGLFDAIVCRNVLIYFGDRTTSEVARSLADALVPGGVLLVGASESLLRFGTALVCEEHGGAFIYRKPPR